ncbi:MAG: HNH endonuclease [Methylobacterium organophilum]|nr:HNH endonuclease [Methylobacterium organophilum]
MALIKVSRGFQAEIDDADVQLVADKKWWLKPSSHGTQRFYAYTCIAGKNRFMHRLILGVTDPKIFVDHIDMDGLNNRRSNLRLATATQNNIHRTMPNKTGFRGVTRFRKGFRASIYVDGKALFSPMRLSAEDAAREYDAFARRYHGEFAVLNFR